VTKISVRIFVLALVFIVGCSSQERTGEAWSTKTGGLSGDETGAEGATLAWTVDTSNLPPHTELRWIFGDGTIRMGGDHESHAYVDNGTYVLIVVALLGGQEITRWTLDIVITNAPPIVDLGADRDWVPEHPFQLAALITDPGRDEFTAHVEWGDGTAEDVVLHGRALEADHVYEASGTFHVTATVTDLYLSTRSRAHS